MPVVAIRTEISYVGKNQALPRNSRIPILYIFIFYTQKMHYSLQHNGKTLSCRSQLRQVVFGSHSLIEDLDKRLKSLVE